MADIVHKKWLPLYFDYCSSVRGEVFPLPWIVSFSTNALVKIVSSDYSKLHKTASAYLPSQLTRKQAIGERPAVVSKIVKNAMPGVARKIGKRGLYWPRA